MLKIRTSKSTILILSAFTAITLFYGLNFFLISRFADNYGEVIKKTSANYQDLEKKILDEKTSRDTKKFLIGLFDLYSLTSECMDYYGTGNPDVYMEIQKKLYNRHLLKENYDRFRFMKENNEKLDSVLTD